MAEFLVQTFLTKMNCLLFVGAHFFHGSRFRVEGKGVHMCVVNELLENVEHVLLVNFSIK